MSRKIDRALRGPSWVEVILGALISLVVGVLLGAGLLIFRPVVAVKTMPKAEAVIPNAVYFIEGSRDSTRGRDAAAKRKAFVEGRTVSVIEDELNALAGPASTFAAAPAGAAAAPKSPDQSGDEILTTGNPNFRIHDGALQVGVPATLSLLGMSERVIVQTRGGFVKRGDALVYDPEVFYVGSLPVQRLPIVAKFAREKFLSAQMIPDDVKAAWMKVSKVTIDSKMMTLTMP
jgi:hypothetical protein